VRRWPVGGDDDVKSIGLKLLGDVGRIVDWIPQFAAGVRQGMPLSPILANLVLAEFDREVERAAIEMVRYVDDFLIFFASKAAANAGH